MLQKIHLLIWFLFSVLPLAAQNEIPNTSYFKWGEIQIPISELTNGSNGIIELPLPEILASANEPLQLFKNGENAGLKSFFIIITKEKNKASPKFIQIEDYDEKDAVSWHGKDYLRDHLREGENIYFRNLKGKDQEEYFLRIKVSYENPPVKFDFDIPKIPTEEVFEFQILEVEKEKVLVKLDTTNSRMDKIFEMYKKLDRYEIVHIPNFQTTRRYITIKNKIIFKNEVVKNWIKDEKLKNINLELLSEFANYDDSIIELKWGEMVSSNEQPNLEETSNSIVIETASGSFITLESYDQYDLQDAIGGRFMLVQGFQNYPILRMKVVLLKKGEAPISYIVKNINHPELGIELMKIQGDTTILITDILTKDKNEALLHFPPSFIFEIK